MSQAKLLSSSLFDEKYPLTNKTRLSILLSTGNKFLSKLFSAHEKKSAPVEKTN
jgi:hypothetical protein